MLSYCIYLKKKATKDAPFLVIAELNYTISFDSMMILSQAPSEITDAPWNRLMQMLWMVSSLGIQSVVGCTMNSYHVVLASVTIGRDLVTSAAFHLHNCIINMHMQNVFAYFNKQTIASINRSNHYWSMIRKKIIT